MRNGRFARYIFGESGRAAALHLLNSDKRARGLTSYTSRGGGKAVYEGGNDKSPDVESTKKKTRKRKFVCDVINGRQVSSK